MCKELAGKIALVTGAARGIGQAIALHLAELGAAVAVNDLFEEPAAATAAQIQAAGGRASAAPANVSDAAAVEAMVEGVVQEWGGLHILVNNAGITRDTLLLRMKEEDWEAVLDTNLKGAFLCTKAVLRPMMKARWGRIVNIASVVGLAGNAGQANYAAAKAGLIGFTRSIAREAGSRSITVNAIAPGFICTEMTSGLPEAMRQAALEQTPLRRLGQPEDIAAAVGFFCSEKAGFITGQILSVDGGMVMR
ncbi:MAG: 3-oxoacyl-ACP reductase FabG [Chloroflexia bacterium]|nr:3-oxoacyl-ACP reductase FabG [Chloroflexia bacterium]